MHEYCDLQDETFPTDRCISHLEEHVKRCHVFRDIRDVAASAKCKFPISWNELLVILDQAIEAHNQIQVCPGVLTQRYENVFDDPASACIELARHLEIEITTDRCRVLAHQCVRSLIQTPALFPLRARLRNSFNHVRVTATKALIRLIPKTTRRLLARSGLQKINDGLTRTRTVADPLTLMHPDHFSPNQAQPGAWRQVFTVHEQRTLLTAHRNLRCIGCKYGRDFMPGSVLPWKLAEPLLHDAAELQLCYATFPFGNLNDRSLKDMLFGPEHIKAAQQCYALDCPNCHCGYNPRVEKHAPTRRKYSVP